MTLTGPLLVVVLVGLVVAAIGAAVVFWRRLAAPTPWAVAARVASILGINVLVLALAAVVMNDYYLFFTDWNDLMGAGATVSYSAHAGASAAHVFGPGSVDLTGGTGGTGHGSTAAPVMAPRLPPLPAGAGPGRRQLNYVVAGRASGIHGWVVVILPRTYFDRGAANRRYPVIEAFPGYPGSNVGLARNLDLQATVDQVSTDRRMADALVVIPVTEFPAGTDTECVNGPAGTPQVETWAAVDVPNWVSSHFRVATGRASWATLGVSSGAYCAAMVTMRHPQQFGAAISMAGYFRPEWGNWTPFGAHDPAAARYDLVSMAATAPPPVALWVLTSRADRLSYPSTRAMLAAVRAPLAMDSTVVSAGGHRWSEWQPFLAPALEWLGRYIPGFAPRATP